MTTPAASKLRLVVQHPTLTAAAVAAFAVHLGSPATQPNPGVAVWTDIPVDAGMDRTTVAALAGELRVDAALVPDPASLRDYRLLALDMDSTLITIECIDEIADYAGRKAEVAAITEAAMRGEIKDYDESLRRRVSLLAGLDEAILTKVYEERLRLSPGAEALVHAAQRAGLKTLLVSGGFTYFTDRLQAELGLDYARSNTLEVRDGKLTGQVSGDIVNASAKAQILQQTSEAIGFGPKQAIVIGDGANDLDMLSLAGLSIAYHAKPLVRSRTTWAINYCGLDAVLHLL